MKILYSHDIFSKQKFGGISRYFVNLVSHLPEDAKPVIFSGLSINSYLDNIKNYGFRVPDLKKSGLFREKVNNFSQDILSKSMSPDIFHKTYYSNHNKSSKGKTVLTVYDMIHERFPECFEDNGALSLIKKRDCEKADHIIAISESTKNDLMHFFNIDFDKISVIYLSSNIKKNNIIQKIHKKPYILFVGNRHEYKNFNSLLNAYANSKTINRNFDLVCFGGEKVSMIEKNIISKNKIKDKVIFISGKDSVLSDLYSNARLLVYPSLYEGFGLPLLEAMSLSCPVVCYDNSSLKEVVGNSAAIIDTDIQCFLESIIFDDEYLSKLKLLGIERSKLFSWKSCSDTTYNLYDKLISL
jgi:glycosyltransferase involved in cell wall biosynthesis